MDEIFVAIRQRDGHIQDVVTAKDMKTAVVVLLRKAGWESLEDMVPDGEYEIRDWLLLLSDSAAYLSVYKCDLAEASLALNAPPAPAI